MASETSTQRSDEPVELPLVLRGRVVEGDRRGRTLGFPTANLELADQAAMPRFGIYAGWALGRPAAVSIGVRPAVGRDLQPTVEAYILDFAGDLYGRELELELVEYLRGEEPFESMQALQHQIELDVERVRSIVANDPRYGGTQ
jgi:riboflavin kinase / FMN adenylyltransferase